MMWEVMRPNGEPYMTVRRKSGMVYFRFTGGTAKDLDICMDEKAAPQLAAILQEVAKEIDRDSP